MATPENDSALVTYSPIEMQERFVCVCGGGTDKPDRFSKCQNFRGTRLRCRKSIQNSSRREVSTLVAHDRRKNQHWQEERTLNNCLICMPHIEIEAGSHLSGHCITTIKVWPQCEDRALCSETKQRTANSWSQCENNEHRNVVWGFLTRCAISKML